MYVFYDYSDRTKYRTRGTDKQIVGGPEDTEDPTLHAVSEVCGSHDGVQSDADRL